MHFVTQPPHRGYNGVPMARILVIEDEKDIQDVLDYNLKQAGHKVQLAGTGRDGLRLARERRPDLVLLDLMLPDMPGTEVCKALKHDPVTRDAQVMMLTAKGEEIDRVIGFELGADDYVVKPFSVRELLLRIQAILRRGAPESEQSGSNIAFGVLRVDREAHRVWIGDKEVDLTALEFKLLVTLHDRRNRVQTRDTLLNDVWGIQAEITTRTVDTHVKRLREKLGAAGEYIQTVRGVGYRFAGTPDEAVAR
jgi:two-component system phosphate regulon response regulator PhoB